MMLACRSPAPNLRSTGSIFKHISVFRVPGQRARSYGGWESTVTPAAPTMADSRPVVTYIERHQLVDYLAGEQKREVLIVDVRDSDFMGGNIVGAVNLQSHVFTDDTAIDEVLRSHVGDNKTVCVFHCMLSQVRGPRAAQRFASRLLALGRDKPTVHVLRGGFQGFAPLYRSNPELFENVDPAFWS